MRTPINVIYLKNGQNRFRISGRKSALYWWQKIKHVLASLGETPGTISPIFLCQCAPWPLTHIPGFVKIRGVRVDHFSYPTRTRSRWCYPYPYPTRAENFYPYPTRPAGIPVPVAYPYDYRTISVKPMARGGSARVTHLNVIWLHFDCECRQVDISRLLGGKLTSSDLEKIDFSRL